MLHRSSVRGLVSSVAKCPGGAGLITLGRPTGRLTKENVTVSGKSMWIWFALAIVSLLKDTARRQAMSEAGQVWVRDNFDWNRVLDRWEAMFSRVVEDASIMV